MKTYMYRFVNGDDEEVSDNEYDLMDSILQVLQGNETTTLRSNLSEVDGITTITVKCI